MPTAETCSQVARQQAEQVCNVAFLQRQTTVHVGLTKAQLGIDDQIPDRFPVIQLDDDR